jgi:hypothetical protein
MCLEAPVNLTLAQKKTVAWLTQCIVIGLNILSTILNPGIKFLSHTACEGSEAFHMRITDLY